jgi:F-type H+-transporting ATPase subunit b
VKRVLTAGAFAALVVASRAWAEGAEHGGAHSSAEGWTVLARHALNLVVLAFLLVRFALPALRDFMRQRSEGLREQIDGAKREFAAAQQELARLRRQVETSRAEEGDLVAEAERVAQAERERSLAQTRENAERLREDARRIADQEVERARGVLRDEAAELATELAARLLRERMNAEDDRRLFDEFAQRAGSAS